LRELLADPSSRPHNHDHTPTSGTETPDAISAGRSMLVSHPTQVLAKVSRGVNLTSCFLRAVGGFDHVVRALRLPRACTGVVGGVAGLLQCLLKGSPAWIFS